MVRQEGSTGVIAGIVVGGFAVVLALAYPIWTPLIYTDEKPVAREGWITAAQVNRRVSGEVQTITQKVDGLVRNQAEMQKSILMARLPGMIMVAGELNNATASSTSFERELRLFRAVAGDAPQTAAIVETLSPLAAAGVPTRAELIGKFDSVVYAIISADQRITSLSQLPEQMSATMAGISAITMRLRWRLQGLPTGDGVPAITARAEKLVADGNLLGALTELDKLPDPAKALVAEWSAGVRARQAVEAAAGDVDPGRLVVLFDGRTIEAVGDGVKDYSIGDEVYGCAGGLADLPGTLAEYIVADSNLIGVTGQVKAVSSHWSPLVLVSPTRLPPSSMLPWSSLTLLGSLPMKWPGSDTPRACISS